ncbi:type II toxin-antitoxin system RelE/ParE family toxin [Mannheimia haemolytica]|uniref:type II toxin-antitoxin system RelE/ParE family toxin n=1 Tax=Mannheimia haemolytica TaxID=75985 RepID=UPI0038F81ED7
MNGNFGDHKSLAGTGGLYEMRIATGAGYRIYYAQQGNVIYILLHGGDKSTQQADIEKAKALWAELKTTGGKQWKQYKSMNRQQKSTVYALLTWRSF